MDRNIFENNLEILKIMGYDDLKLVEPLEVEDTKDGLHTYTYILMRMIKKYIFIANTISKGK